MAPSPTSIPSRLLQALTSINATAPRLISTPPHLQGSASAASRRASVAIIIRLRPSATVNATSSSSATPSSSSSNSTPQNAFGTSSNPAIALSPSPSTPPPVAPIPSPTTPSALANPKSVQTQLHEFFSQPWVQDPGTTAEILFIKRASRATDKWSGHIAFPGGRQEAEDEDARYTAMRETWEEVGLDLAEKEWLAIGQLDDREITTSLGKRLLMILSPFVFLHTSAHTPVPELQASEVASAHWVPLELLHAPQAKYGVVGIDISSRLAPRSPVARFALRLLVGSMHFRCVLLPNDPVAIGQVTPRNPDGSLPELKLWGLTLGMTLDLLSSMALPPSARGTSPSDLSTYPHAVTTLDPQMSPFAPSMASIFPTFTYPDINLLIWLFGFRYRRLARQTVGRVPRVVEGPDGKSTTVVVDPRVDWMGARVLGSYYSAVRRALVVAVVLRALTAGLGLGGGFWWLRRKMREKKLSL
ncbi:hypothetical protein T439DRAFT_309686 [Meredithblackwellia eburnea MCA 4105]